MCEGYEGGFAIFFKQTHQSLLISNPYFVGTENNWLNWDFLFSREKIHFSWAGLPKYKVWKQVFSPLLHGWSKSLFLQVVSWFGRSLHRFSWSYWSLFCHDLQSLPLGLVRHSERGASVLLRTPQHPSLQPLLTLSCLPHHPLQKLLVPPSSRWPGCRSQTKENT